MSYGINIKKLEFFREEYTNCFFISTTKYTWKFILDNNPHLVILLYTKFFGKRILYLDNKEISNSKKYTYNFNISFPIDFYNITIIQKNYFYTLKINNISFNNIINDLKLKKFNILEDSYKEKQKQKKLRQLKKRKNRILEKTINNFYKNEKIEKNNLNKANKILNGLETIHEENINTENNFKEESNNEDDSRTIHESFEMHDKIFSILDNKPNDLNDINNINNVNNKDVNSNKNFEKNDDKNSIYKKKKSFRSLKKNKRDKFNPSEKIKYKTYENVNSSLNEMIDVDLLRDENHNSEERNNSNFLSHNIFNSNNVSFFDKGSMTTQSN